MQETAPLELAVTAQSSFEPSEALPFQMGIEVLEALDHPGGTLSLRPLQ